jgi:hypothetical protein
MCLYYNFRGSSQVILAPIARYQKTFRENAGTSLVDREGVFAEGFLVRPSAVPDVEVIDRRIVAALPHQRAA